MNWNEFKNNVERWAEERGIYEHSTAEAQLLKALSELGELADAMIKNDREAMKDAIGDLAVCWINYCKMNGFSISTPITASDLDKITGDALRNIGGISLLIARGIEIGDGTGASLFFDWLQQLSYHNDLDFLDCCAAAWNEIKDRKGRIATGGAFIKED